jgi:hypothetical protein
MPQGVTIRHADEFEHPWPNWILVRKGLGLQSFGEPCCSSPGESPSTTRSHAIRMRCSSP